MSKLRQVHLLARPSAASSGYRWHTSSGDGEFSPSATAESRNGTSSRHSGRRAVRGAVLLAGLLGSLGALAASAIPADAATNNSLHFYYNVDGSPTWNP